MKRELRIFLCDALVDFVVVFGAVRFVASENDELSAVVVTALAALATTNLLRGLWRAYRE